MNACQDDARQITAEEILLKEGGSSIVFRLDGCDVWLDRDLMLHNLRVLVGYI